MASSDKAVAAGATVLSGLAWWFGTGLAPMAWLAWLAPLPMLLAATRMRWHATALAGLAAGACAGLNQWHYVVGVIGLPPLVGVLIAAVPGVSFALCLLLFRRLWLAERFAAAVTAFPSLWVVLEYLGALRSPHGTFGNLAYSQMDALPVIQLASVAGVWGVSFIVLLAPAALAALLMRGRRSALVGGAALALVGASLAYGALRLREPASGSVRVGLVSLAGPVRAVPSAPEGRLLLRRYLAAIDGLAARGAQIVVLPEVQFAPEQGTLPELAETAQRLHVVIDTGAALKDAAHGERNMALAYLPEAAAPLSYAKHHLIPGLESQYRAGTEPAMLPGTRTGLAICKDMDFQDTGAAYAARRANLLLVPAWDFQLDGWLHSRMAVMRGVESGFAMARAARHGRLTLSDDRGRVVAETDDAHGDAQLLGVLPLHQTRTLYARWGDWFAWGAIALLAFACRPLPKRRGARRASADSAGRLVVR